MLQVPGSFPELLLRPFWLLALPLPCLPPSPSVAARRRRPPGKRSPWGGAWALSDSKWLSLFVFSLVCFLLGSGAEACGDHT